MTVAKLVAPFAPFFADQLYQDLGGKLESIHLELYPKADESLIDKELEARMGIAQKITSMVLALRRKVNIKVRQPLQQIMIPAIDEEQKKHIAAVADLIKNEVNVKELNFVEGQGILVKKVKCNFRVMGKKFGKQMKAVAAKMASLSQEEIAQLETQGSYSFEANGTPITVEAADVDIISEDIPGWLVANEGNLTVALEVELTDELRQQLDDNVQRTGIVTRDRRFLKLLEQAAVAARTNVPVLIRGENGVGKELVARYIHSCSERKDRPMVIVNCSSIPETLIESELFGYEEGSFTGAKKGGRMGKFELANHGTIFLDEIGDMPIALQSRLLRVIENGEIEKIGRQKSIPVDVRIIAATNQPLEKMIREKQFRMDLFYRLNVISMSIPALRERKEDIPVLADYFLREFCSKYDRERSISEKGYSRLVEREWLGNVRELRNCIERAVILSEGETLDFKELASAEAKESDAAGMADSAGGKEWTAFSDMKLEEALAACEESCIRQALKEFGGNRAEAIRRLGISRRTFYRKCAQYGILENGASGEEEL